MPLASTQETYKYAAQEHTTRFIKSQEVPEADKMHKSPPSSRLHEDRGLVAKETEVSIAIQKKGQAKLPGRYNR